MKIEDSGSCDDCGTDNGPFVHFGGGTMASEDCWICMACIGSAHHATHFVTMINGPMAGHRATYTLVKWMPFRDETGRFHWYELIEATGSDKRVPRFVWLYRGENDSDATPPEVTP